MRKISLLLAGAVVLGAAPALALDADEPGFATPATIAQAPAGAPLADLAPIEALVAPPFVSVLPPRRPSGLDRPAVARPARPAPQRAAAARLRVAPAPIQVASAAPGRRCTAMCGRFILIGVGF